MLLRHFVNRATAGQAHTRPALFPVQILSLPCVGWLRLAQFPTPPLPHFLTTLRIGGAESLDDSVHELLNNEI